MRTAILLLTAVTMSFAGTVEVFGVVDSVSGPNPKGIQVGDQWGLSFITSTEDYKITPYRDSTGVTQLGCTYCALLRMYPITPGAISAVVDTWSVYFDESYDLMGLYVGGGGTRVVWGADSIGDPYPHDDKFSQRYYGTEDGEIAGRITSARYIGPPPIDEAANVPEPSTLLLAGPALLWILMRRTALV